MSMDMPNTTSAPPSGFKIEYATESVAGTELLTPALRQWFELERRQLIARLKLVERLLGVASRAE